MKPFTNTQKKWAMTACLLGALTFNLSMHSNAIQSFEADFASTEDQDAKSDILETNSRGTVKVRYVKDGTGTIAEVSKMTEGKVCENCGKSYIPMDTSFGDITKLNMALVKQLDGKKAKAEESKEEKDEKAEDKKIADEEAKEKKAEEARIAKDKRDKAQLLRDMKVCDADVAAEKADCMVEAYLSLIKTKDRSEKTRVSKEVSLDVFRKQIEPKIKDVLTTNTKIFENAEEQRQYNNEIKSMLLTLDKIKSNLPEEQNNVRARTVTLEKEVMQLKSLKLKESLTALKNNPKDNYAHAIAMQDIAAIKLLGETMDSMNNPLLYKEGNRTVQDMMRIDRATVNGELLNSLQKAVSSGYISQTQALELYKKEYNQNVTALLNGVTKSYTLQGGQTLVDPAQIILDNAAATFGTNPRLQVPAGPGRAVLPAEALQQRLPMAPGQTSQAPTRTFGGRGF